MQEESGIRDDQGHFPGTLTYSFVESLTSQRSPALHLVEHFLRGMLAVSTSGTHTDKQRSGTITLHIVVHSVTGRHREELYTRIFPNRTVIVACNCAYTRFPYLEMQQNGIFRMRYAELHTGSIRKSSPIHCIYGLKRHFLFIQKSRNRLYRYIGHTYFLYIQFFHFTILGINCRQRQHAKSCCYRHQILFQIHESMNFCISGVCSSTLCNSLN